MPTNCNTLLAALPFACAAADAPGGVRGTVYVGFRADLASVTFGTNGDITVLTMASGKKLYKYEGRKFKHNPKRTLVPGSTLSMIKHEVPLTLYARTQAQIKAIENLVFAKKMFCIYETEDGLVYCSGIDVHPYKASDLDDERGLTCSALENSEGTAYNAGEENAYKVTMDGEFFQLQKLVTSALATRTTLTQIIGDLDLLTV